MRQPNRTLASTTVVALAVSGLSATAHAQARPANENTLEEVVVTAQKRQESMQDVPIAVAAASGEQLEVSGVTSVESLKMAFSGLNMRIDGNEVHAFIRGIGTGTNNVESPVAMYVDGVYYASTNDARRDLLDIEQVAVLKGPQGTLFGRNATAGVIQVTTQAPAFEFGGKVNASLENYGLLRTGAYVTGPLSDRVAFSLSGSYATQSDGWGTNLITGRDTYRIRRDNAGRGKLLFKLGEATDVTLIGDYADRLRDSSVFGVARGYKFNPALNYVEPAIYDSRAGSPEINRYKGGGLSATVNHDFGFARLQSITAYRSFLTGYTADAEGTPSIVFSLDTSHTRGRTFSQEFGLSSAPGGRVNWTAGLYYFRYRNALEPVVRLFGGVFAPAATSTVRREVNSSEDVKSLAPFVQADVEVAPKTRLTVGARYTDESRELNGTQTHLRANGQLVLNPIGPIVGLTVKAKKPTWRVALDHQFSDDVMGYVSYNRGFKSGGFNISNLANPPYQTEKLDALETGLKTELLDRRLRLNTSAFYYKYENLQVVTLISGVASITNGAKAKLYGLDVDLEAQLAAGLRLTAGAELLHSEFTDYLNAGISTPIPAGGVTIVTGSANGNRLPLAQKFVGNVALDYTRAVSVGTLGLNAMVNFNGDFYMEPDNVLKQDAYQIVNLTASWTSPNDRLKVSVFGRNLLDERILSFAGASGGIGYLASYDDAPRTYGVGVQVRF